MSSSQLPLSRAFERYLRTVSSKKKGHNQEIFRARVICASALGEKPMAKITGRDIAAYRDSRLATVSKQTKRLITNSTVLSELALLSDLFEIARTEWHAVRGNPTKDIRKPKPNPPRTRRLRGSEERRTLRACLAHKNPALYSIVVLAIETAMRQGEILGLTWENIDIRSGVASLPHTKNGSPRDVPLSIRARDALTRLGIRSEGRVFSSSADSVKGAWRSILTSLRVKTLRFHDLRHEATSRLFERGLDVMEVATITGHKDLKMLRRYTHLSAKLLVAKLDGKRADGRMLQRIMNVFQPYPAFIEDHADGIRLKFTDFEDLHCTAADFEEAIEKSKNVLLRRQMQMLKDRSPLPMASDPIMFDDHSKIVIIDPV